ncbi:MAG: beta-galactosidase [Lachnospiraceae bacterium]|nr:beta-galactosidase [Lachnospiraceae bacterium]
MKQDCILFGAAYYDEYMPYDRIETDMQMIKKAGMNTIRIAESTWSTWEPQEGEFDFTHLDRMLDASEKYGLNVIVGTPTYAVPTWLVRLYPDILPVTHGGQNLYGPRQNMDITHPMYLKYAERMIRKLMERVQGRSNVIGFQLDNETKAYDTCSKYAQQQFVSYMKEQYPDINEFNHEFGLDYWSNRINNWADFPDIRATINGSLGAEYEKFQRKLVTDFFAWQAAIVREYATPDQFITQNFDYEWRNYSFGMQPLVNQFEAAKCMDVAGVDIYHPSESDLTGAEIAFGGSMGRGIKGSNYLVLETEAQGNLGWLPYEGQLRLQAYSHISSGSNSVMYWHWHSIHNSFETYWKGLLSHDFSENVTYKEAMQIGAEFNAIGSQIKNLQKKNKVAFMLDNASLTGLKWFPISDSLNYNDIMRWLYDAFYHQNIECDVIPVTYDNLADYELIVIPALYSASEATLARINAYVESGGHILVTFKSAFSNEHLKVYSDAQPHALTNCLGITYDQFTIPKNVTLGSNGNSYEVSEWLELVTPSTAEVWNSYEHKHWSKYAAITHNEYGKGTATYLACYFDQKYLEQVIARLWTKLGNEMPSIQFPLICKEGINDEGQLVQFYFNYSDDDQTFVYNANDGVALLDNKEIHKGDSITIPSWDCLIVKHSI